jgi:PAS domain S-box-containing protein
MNNSISKEDTGHYRRLVELSPDLILLLDEQGVIRYANLASMDVLRINTPEEVLNHKIEDFLPDHETKQTQAILERIMMASGETPLEETRFRRMDETWFYAEMMASPIIYHGEHMTHLVVRDVTRRKEAEQARRKMKLRFAFTAVMLTLMVLTFGSYQFYQYTESTEFCGRFCHSVMAPDLTLHQRSSHSQVSCAECHIGRGAAWYVKAKLSGLHQVYAVATKIYSRPIRTPIDNLRPAMETCEECHSGKVYYSNRDKVYFRYPADSNLKDPRVTLIRLHVGGYLPDTQRAVGIHWHAGHAAVVEYRTDDVRRLKIREVRVTEQGGVRIYTQHDLPELPTGTPWRTMDCTDCHNRVAHQYESPDEALDRLLFQGKLNISIPDLKKAAIEVLSRKYASTKEARIGILKALESYYREHFPDTFHRFWPSLANEANILSELAYQINISPEMNIGWNHYIDLSGHENDLGCFRCHDEKHIGEKGTAISQDCGLCHDIPVEGVPLSKLDKQSQALILLR